MPVMDGAVATIAAQPADDPGLREAQRQRLRALRAELVAEGADGTAMLRELEQRAATWPE